MFILENRDIVRTAVERKRGDPVDFDRLEALYTKRNALVQKSNEINRRRKDAAGARDTEQGGALKQESAAVEESLRGVTKELTGLIMSVPNIPSPDVPVGADESDNVVLRQVGEKPSFDFSPKPHWELGVERGFIDTERAAKVAGSRFAYLRGPLVRLQFSLIQWVLDTVTDTEVLRDIISDAGLRVSPAPFIPVLPPAVITPEMLFGMARLEPKEDRYFLSDDNVFLAGSAEHTLGAMHANEQFTEHDLPLRYIGYSTSFRREAGSYGRDTKGILRQHQFDKLEFESFTVGEQSREEQDFLVAVQEYLLRQLALPYRVVAVCTGDMGAPDVRQIDIETWMPGQDQYRETHSADLMGEYQSRRLGIRVKRDSGEREFVHMNDATAFALGRILIALMENRQHADGSVAVPEVLQPYMNGMRSI